MVYKIYFIVFLSFFSIKPTKERAINSTKQEVVMRLAENNTVSKTEQKFSLIEENSTTVPSLESFEVAFEGYENLKSQNKLDNSILTIIDFSLSSNQKRLWVIDMDSNEVLFHTLVAHGMNSGQEFATNFSNKSESYKSSLGFYLTAEIYTGKHGSSLKLDGIEKGINDNARERAIVIHGADYVSEAFARNNGRLGRSQGCPALPSDLTSKIISKIKNKSVLFIYHPSRKSSLVKGLMS
ncbi:murein L,D-transpeptidase catalytic domain family protein [uncultured Flavobacterium sp.]|uniref:murein L,D-transpeptidase catalytic domain family protein n=1 Tax=uncultured Flavobacterium sp. TaxID=165435 RepID=UPI0030EB8F2D|tara:strand:- start:1338 stop:2054 length:717 start_codon:yes stop_codon:yes gene_type:complete